MEISPKESLFLVPSASSTRSLPSSQIDSALALLLFLLSIIVISCPEQYYVLRIPETASDP